MAPSRLAALFLVAAAVVPGFSVADYDGGGGGGDIVRLNLQPVAQLVHVRNEKRRRRRRLQAGSELDVEDYLDMEASFAAEVRAAMQNKQGKRTLGSISGVYAASQLNLIDGEDQVLHDTEDGDVYSRQYSKYETEARFVDTMRRRQRRRADVSDSPFGAPEKLGKTIAEPLEKQESLLVKEFIDDKDSSDFTEEVQNGDTENNAKSDHSEDVEEEKNMSASKSAKGSPFGTPETLPTGDLKSPSSNTPETQTKDAPQEDNSASQKSDKKSPRNSSDESASSLRGKKRNRNKKNKRQKQSPKLPHQITPLMQGYGTHYATAWVGTPPQRKSVIVDTGSHFTAFPCVGCKDCGEEHHTDKYFDPELSSTFEVVGCDICQGTAFCQTGNNQCHFSQSYTEGSSWHAYQVQDEFFLGGNDPHTAPTDSSDSSFSMPFMFGCQTSETGLFRTQLADGIMGMSAHEATLPKALFDAGRLQHNMFAMCFRRELSVSKEGVTAGVMTLGGRDERLAMTPMVYAGNMHNPEGGWYTVTVRAMFVLHGVNGTEESELEKSRIITPDKAYTQVQMDVDRFNNGKGVIVDSGTTDTYLSDGVKESFNEAWFTATGGSSYHHNAMQITREEMLALPTVLIQLKAYEGDAPNPTKDSDPDTIPGLVGTTLDKDHPHDVLLAIPPTHYMEYSPEKETYTSRLYFTERTGGVLGANAMQGHDVLFDWENARVGFASSSCEHSDLLESDM